MNFFSFFFQELKPHISAESGIDVAELIRSRLDWFKGIKSSDSELAALKKQFHGELVEPVKRDVGEHRSCIKDAEGREVGSKVSSRTRAGICR